MAAALQIKLALTLILMASVSAKPQYFVTFGDESYDSLEDMDIDVSTTSSSVDDVELAGETNKITHFGDGMSTDGDAMKPTPSVDDVEPAGETSKFTYFENVISIDGDTMKPTPSVDDVVLAGETKKPILPVDDSVIDGDAIKLTPSVDDVVLAGETKKTNPSVDYMQFDSVRSIRIRLIDLASPSITKKPDVTKQVTPRPPTNKIFFLNTIVKVNWYQALELCHAMGKELASVDSQEEYDYLVSMINEASIEKDVNFWLAGTDLGHAGVYVWASNGKPVSYQKWAKGEPNHAAYDGDVEHCMTLWSPRNYEMNDDQCTKTMFHVCQGPNTKGVSKGL